MKIGGMLAGGFLLEISMASLLLGWGVNLLMRHHLFNLRSVTHAVDHCVVSKHIDGSRRHKGRKNIREKRENCWPQNGPLRDSERHRYHL